MTAMSRVEGAFCRSAPWRWFARRTVLPWALDDAVLSGDVLEIGAGSGAMAAELLRREPGVLRLQAVDIDPAMVRRASTRLLPFGQRAASELADSTRLPYGDGSFDAVVSWLMLHHTIDWETALAEARRVLRPGGLLIGYDLLDTAPTRLVHRLDGSPHRLYSHVALRDALSALFVSVDTSVRLGGLVCRFRSVA